MSNTWPNAYLSADGTRRCRGCCLTLDLCSCSWQGEKAQRQQPARPSPEAWAALLEDGELEVLLRHPEHLDAEDVAACRAQQAQRRRP